MHAGHAFVSVQTEHLPPGLVCHVCHSRRLFIQPPFHRFITLTSCPSFTSSAASTPLPQPPSFGAQFARKMAEAFPSPHLSRGPPSPHKRRRLLRDSEDNEGNMDICYVIQADACPGGSLGVRPHCLLAILASFHLSENPSLPSSLSPLLTLPDKHRTIPASH
jgi:hypothetical protein